MSISSDAFYTPESAAIELVDGVIGITPLIICDSCVGDGSLLAAGRLRWKCAELFGFDIDSSALSILRKTGISVGKRDAISIPSRGKSKLWKGILGKVDLFLLNPPFTSRGCKRFSARLDGFEFSVSKPLFFLLDSLDSLRKGGQMALVLPTGALDRACDALAWKAIRQLCSVRVVSPSRAVAWKGCSVEVVYVYIKRERKHLKKEIFSVKLEASSKGNEFFSDDFVVKRGNVGNTNSFENFKNGSRFIHTSNLQHNKLKNLIRVDLDARHVMIGPGIILPRVGRPDQRKIVVIRKGYQFVPSDCILFVSTISIKDAQDIYLVINKYWEKIVLEYKGGCAKHLTVTRLNEIVRMAKENTIK